MTQKTSSTLPLAVAFALWSTASNAGEFADQVATRYQELGFDYIEIKEGISQLKVEAVRGNQKYEVIYDQTTGRILKQEIETAEAGEIGRTGIEIDSERRDFLDRGDVRNGSDDEDDESDESDGSDEGDESDDSDESDESDDDEDDDESDESDDDEDDDSDESDDSEDDED